jgi:HD-GYP domain-containing protein (c-di-GMP phosphodiesterase class II)
MDLINRITDQLEGSESLLSETVRQRRHDESVPARSANTAILALRLGLELGYEKRRATALGLCALMHDVGMLMIPPEITGSSRLTGEQLSMLRTHPTRSREIVEGFGESFKWIGSIVVQVHERFDGSGYPRRLKGEQIHEFARILGLADTYEAMAHPRADRKALVIYEALKEIVDMDNSLFDRRLVKSLLDIVSIFPLGSLVKLNSGEIGRVVGTSKQHPTRPCLEVLVDSRGKRLTEMREYRLEEEPMLYIVDPGVEESVLHDPD